MIDKNIKYMAIFEDDIYLGKNANNFLTDDQWISDNLIDIYVIKLETAFKEVHLDKTFISYKGRCLTRLKSHHTGAAAYIISNKAAAALLKHVRALDLKNYIAIDHIVFGKLLNELHIYQISSALSIQSTFLEADNPTLTSDLEAERSEHRKSRSKDTQET